MLSLEAKVGAFVVTGLVLLAAAIFLLGEYHLEKRYTIYATFHDVANLNKNAPVKLSGVEVGQVADIVLIDRDTFQRLYREEEDRFRAIAAERAGGGDFYRTQRTRSGRRFARALIESTLEGRTPYRDALRLLGMSKVGTFHEFARQLDFPV